MKVIGSKKKKIERNRNDGNIIVDGTYGKLRDRLIGPAFGKRGEQVEVSLCAGLADEEEGAGLESAPVDTKSAGGTGLDVRWFPRRLRALRYRTIHCPRQSPISSMVWRSAIR